MKTKRVSKEYLYNQYVTKQKSIRKVASDLGVAMATVQRWLVRYDIPRRPQNEYERTPEWRQRMSDAKTGKWAGENNPNWKGGISREIHGERSVGSVSRWRKSVKRRDNYVCQNCGLDAKKACSTCGNKPRLHADHIKPWKNYPDLRFDLNNGRTLCEDCHIRRIG